MEEMQEEEWLEEYIEQQEEEFPRDSFYNLCKPRDYIHMYIRFEGGEYDWSWLRLGDDDYDPIRGFNVSKFFRNRQINANILNVEVRPRIDPEMEDLHLLLVQCGRRAPTRELNIMDLGRRYVFFGNMGFKSPDVFRLRVSVNNNFQVAFVMPLSNATETIIIHGRQQMFRITCTRTRNWNGIIFILDDQQIEQLEREVALRMPLNDRWNNRNIIIIFNASRRNLSYRAVMNANEALVQRVNELRDNCFVP